MKGAKQRLGVVESRLQWIRSPSFSSSFCSIGFGPTFLSFDRIPRPLRYRRRRCSVCSARVKVSGIGRRLDQSEPEPTRT
jgi:hypothetical protein